MSASKPHLSLPGPAPESRHLVSFGPFRLDLTTPELHRGGRPVDIQATPLRLLAALAARAGEVVSKQDLIDTVWQGTAVSDASLSTALREVRRVLSDDGREQRFVQTLRRRGYRFTAVHSSETSPTSGTPQASAPLLHRLGEALFASGRNDEARAAFREASELARNEHDDVGFVRAALRFAGDVANTEPAVALPERALLLEEAIAREACVDDAIRARLRGRLALELAWTTRRLEAVSLAREAVRLSRGSGDPVARTSALFDAFWTLWSPDSLDERLGFAEEMCDVSRGHPRNHAIANLVYGAALLESGDRVRADAAYARLHHEHEGEVRVWARDESSNLRATMAALDGSFEEAERLSDIARRTGRSLGSRNADRMWALRLLCIRVDQGRAHELAELANAFENTAGLGELVSSGIALIRASCGEAEAARASFRALMRDFDAWPRDAFWLGTLAAMAEIASFVGEPADARALHRALAAYADQTVVVGTRTVCRGSVSLYLGLLARTAKDPAAALIHFTAAASANARLRAIPLMARALLEYARTVAAAGGSRSEIDLARANLSQATGLYRGIVVDARGIEMDEIHRALRSTSVIGK